MHDLVNKALELSHTIGRSISQKKWDDVEKLLSDRERLLAQAHQMPPPTSQADSLKIEQLLNEIRALDQRHRESIEANQQALLKAQQTATKGQQMAKAYQQV